jgi:hypothetical protein
MNALRIAMHGLWCALLAGLVLTPGCAGPGSKPSGAPATQPFGGKPHPIPGTIEAEHFDDGAEGASHHDLDSKNQGAPYRKTSVDVEARPDARNGHGVGWTRAGEWLVYTVDVAADGVYTVDVPVASPGKGGTFHLEFNGLDATGPILVPDTGSWQKLQVLPVKGVRLNRGVQTMRLVLDRDGETTKSVADIDCFTFKRQ